MKSRLPIMLTVFPIMKSFGENHSFTSLSDTSITQEGKLASEGGGGVREGGGREGGREGEEDEVEKNTSSQGSQETLFKLQWNTVVCGRLYTLKIYCLSHGISSGFLGSFCRQTSTGKGSRPSLGSCTSLISTVSSTR